jgi:hypothetical protein
LEILIYIRMTERRGDGIIKFVAAGLAPAFVFKI